MKICGFFFFSKICRSLESHSSRYVCDIAIVTVANRVLWSVLVNASDRLGKLTGVCKWSTKHCHPSIRRTQAQNAFGGKIRITIDLTIRYLKIKKKYETPHEHYCNNYNPSIRRPQVRNAFGGKLWVIKNPKHQE